MAPTEAVVHGMAALSGWFHKLWKGHRRYDEVLAALEALSAQIAALDVKVTRLLALWDEG